MAVPKLFRIGLAVLIGASVMTAGAAGAAPNKNRPVLGPNLVQNPSFEEALVDATPEYGGPVPPVGWTFEGATILFDYNDDGARTGKRRVTVSGALAPGRQFCDASSGAMMCTANPAYSISGPVNDEAMKTYSLRPFWLNEKPIKVVAGKRYRFTMYSFRPSLGAADAGAMGEGAESKVRWLDASGKVIAVADGSRNVRTQKRTLGYTMGTADVAAPPGAVGAQVMLGHTDYSVTTPVAFDDVSFQEIIRR